MNRRTSRIGVHRRIGVPANRRNNFQRSDRTDWYTGESAYTDESITGKSAYQIPTFTQQNRLPATGVSNSNFNTTKSITSNWRIKFQRSTQQNRLPAIGVSNSNVQHNKIDYQQLAYQIPTFNTTKSITSNWRIKFQRSTQQNRLPAIGVSNSNFNTTESITSNWRIKFQLQHNKLVHRRSGVPATGESPYRLPTFNTTNWYTGEAAYRRPASRQIDFQLLT